MDGDLSLAHPLPADPRWAAQRLDHLFHGAYEAKTYLTRLLERVAQGEKITITKHGVPVAILQPAGIAKKTPVHETIEQLKQFRKGHRLDGLSIREMIEEGRR
jgi:prevent-host-death family protein